MWKNGAYLVIYFITSNVNLPRPIKSRFESQRQKRTILNPTVLLPLPRPLTVHPKSWKFVHIILRLILPELGWFVITFRVLQNRPPCFKNRFCLRASGTTWPNTPTSPKAKTLTFTLSPTAITDSVS
ncbi:hypothetical protein K435DRAFT_52302 [Dendrothele bispora CBS 962.96]|uniref:Uncharacterized protein n=1 Tax=Dendrothele bispora (strain CBS 962.96) TaxID=1314807 RepID=A0A4S8M6B6_DENBC|nr:hypothetical protein K435DRAFT_52302 [Dendrothele bispora CBS 962.96]